MRKSFFLFISASVMLLLTLTACSREPQEAEKLYVPVVDVLEQTTLLATIAADEKPQAGAATAGHSLNVSDSRTLAFHVVFSERGHGVVYIAEKEGKVLVVHNGKAGKMYQAIDNLRLSPDGQRVAYSIFYDGKSRLVVDGNEGAEFDDVGQPVFSPDGRHVACRASKGEKIYIVVDHKSSDGYRRYFGNPVFSADSDKVAYVEGVEVGSEPRLVISDLSFTKKVIRESTDLMVLSGDMSSVAARQAIDGGQRVVEIRFDKPDAVREGRPYDAVDALALSKDGASLAYAAGKDGHRLMILNGREEPFPAGDLAGPLVVRPDQKGLGCIMASREGFYLHRAFFHDGTKEKRYEEATDLVYNRDGSLHAYAARKGQDWFVVVNGNEGPAFDRVVMPVFSPDGKRLVYRARKDGKRFIVVADESGKTISQHPAYEQVFQPVFTADGKSVAYGIKDGQKLIWKVEKL